MSNLKLWDKLKDVPASAQKKIGAGRLKGMTDISPQWRYHKMTETFGPIGIGWKFSIDRQWIEDGSDHQRCAMTNISLYVKHDKEWSEAIPGTGGSMLVTKETKGLHTSDEAFKMSLTDALSVAMKLIGVGAVVYSGGNDYSKYSTPRERREETITEHQIMNLISMCHQADRTEKSFCTHFKIKTIDDLPADKYDAAVSALEERGA